MSRLELSIAWRYLRSRRGSRLLSLISSSAIAGVRRRSQRLILIIGVMNGLQRDLREKILVGAPTFACSLYGEDLKIADWPGFSRRSSDSRALLPQLRLFSWRAE